MDIVVFAGISTKKKFNRTELTDEIGSLSDIGEIHHLFINLDNETGVIKQDGKIVHYNIGVSDFPFAQVWYASVRLASYIKENDVDAVYNLNLRLAPFVGIACYATQTPHIQRFGNDLNTIISKRGFIKSSVYRILWYFGLQLSDDIHANSKYMKRVAMRFGGHESKVHVVYPNIKVSNREARELNCEGPVIGFVGRLHPRKGIDILIKSLPEIITKFPNIRLIIIGDDMVQGNENGYKAEVERLATELGVNDHIDFVGWVHRDEIFSFYRGFDVLACPSHHEGVHKVVLEGLLSGVPIVASDIPTHRELLNDSRGRIVTRSPEAFAENITQVLEDDEMRSQMGENGTEFAKEIIQDSQQTWEAMFNKYR